MNLQELTNAALGLLALIVILLFLALTATAIFRPKALPDVIALVETIGLALIGKSRSERKRKNEDDDEPPTFPAQ